MRPASRSAKATDMTAAAAAPPPPAITTMAAPRGRRRRPVVSSTRSSPAGLAHSERRESPRATCCCLRNHSPNLHQPQPQQANSLRSAKTTAKTLVAIFAVLTYSLGAAHCAPTRSTAAAAAAATTAPERRPPSPALPAPPADRTDGDLLLVAAADELLWAAEREQRQHPAAIRHLTKRSGISDQRLAEIQMIRALKKQLERASKMTVSEEGPQTGGGQQGSPAD